MSRTQQGIRAQTCLNTSVARGRALAGLLICASALFTVACNAANDSRDGAMSGVVGSTASSTKLTTPGDWPDHYALGQPASPALVALLDTDVDTTGAGLPEGQGTASEGALVYQAKCAGCHGPKGEGIKPAPPLVQAIAANDSFPWAKNAGAPKTVGNYWPFATTLYAYIRHTMPQSAPGSLAPNEVYQLVAYLLAENGVLARDAVMTAQTLPQVKLPMRNRFILDTRRGGREVR